ncbi:MAG: 2-C-methyl-D-erythritol 4-phosphate cytidylyltransferase [Chitinophagaceae bacterium]|nr:2-C-methyl-D-erythritol 4-phosphate cytidylyltransferase [Chitinophagaceae bacterium]
MKKYAVLVAGGSGTRMGGVVPKQFLELAGKPVLLHSIEKFLSAFYDIEIILVIHPSFIEQAKALIQHLAAASKISVIPGGETRFHSVKNGLKQVKDESVIFVHDAVRCMVSEALIHCCYEQALAKGSAIPAVSITDSVRILYGNTTKVIDRNLLKAIQTPQTFRSEIILPAFEQEYNDAFTDEATVVEAAGHEVFLIEGEKENIKITVPSDLIIAEHLLQK